MGDIPWNFSTMSAKNQEEFLKANNITRVEDDKPVTKEFMKSSLGYAKGYSEYYKKFAGPTKLEDGTYSRTEYVENSPAVESFKDIPSKQVNKQINLFRDIDGFTSSGAMEDPTFIVFDIHMDYSTSPLFNEVTNFINTYSDSMPELQERLDMYGQFVGTLAKIFPGDLGDTSGNKRHYINSVSGLDNLFKKIVTYPDDLLTFTLSEDITMLAQYISELYSNLIYSYDTHRYMIPDNLLRFNMTIFFRDVRDMVYNANSSTTNIVNEKISKFAYVLHDCQFDFFTARNFGSDVTVSGFEGGATRTPATLSFNMNYKSYSKLTLPGLIDNSINIDVRERIIGNDTSALNRFNNDYDSYDEQVANTQAAQTAKDLRSLPLNEIGTGDNPISALYEQRKQKLIADGTISVPEPPPTYFDKLKNAFTDELTDVRNVLVTKVQDEVTALSTEAQKFATDKLFGDFKYPGFQNITLTKFNVYYDDPIQAIDRVSFLLDSFISDSLDEIKSRVNIDTSDGKVNIYYNDTNLKNVNITGEGVWDETKDVVNTAINGATPRSSNVYGNSELGGGKTPDGGVYDDAEYAEDERSPETDDGRTDLHEDGTFNEKTPNGDIYEDAEYADYEREPVGDAHEDGQYNEKYPEGDVHEDGQYNEKYPSGRVQPKGTYNEKYPEGDVHEDGQYNLKLPVGDVHEDGQYNEKYPVGDVHEDGQYNEKYPEGDVHPDGKYNEKYPEGKVQPKGQYNEKYPEGRVQPEGRYNQKYPSGDVQEDGQYNMKFPEGDVHPDGEYHDKEPRGEVYEDRVIDESQRRDLGNLYGKKEIKEPEAPEGDVHPDGEYNEKYPDGNLYKKKDNR